MRLRISRCVVQAIQQAAAEAAPHEACGLLFGDDAMVTGYETARNVADAPDRRFEIDPAALFQALREERAGGRRLIGYWHSHPSGEAVPSATDAAMSAPDGKLWAIATADTLTIWRATPDGFVPLGWQIEAEDQSPVIGAQ
jgi:proteasome lid subunit RPN8/RPN11